MEQPEGHTRRRLSNPHGWSVGLLVAAILVAGGCRRDAGPVKEVVSGTVTLDGKPLSKGDVIFSPEAANLPADAGKLQDGRYSFRAVAGRHRVVIRAVSDKPMVTSPVDPPVFESIVPARYNDATTLTADVTPAGPNQFDFKLTSNKSAAK